MIDYSIVIPVYNSEETIEKLVRRIERLFNESSYEIILVDDCSADRCWEILKKIHSTNPKTKIVRLIRNFGQHNALLAGLNICTGKLVITLDDDLQHPPEEITKLISKINEGYSVVYGRYPPKNDNLIENLLSRFYQELIHRILVVPNNLFLSSFVVYKRETVQNIISIKSTYPFLPAMTIKSVPINKVSNADVVHHRRETGTSNYGLFKYFKYSLNLIINYSSLPLIALSIFGFILSLASFGLGFLILINKLLDPNYGVVGWNSTMVAICFIGGVILMGIGIIGEYLRRILTEVSHGQQYVIEEMEP